MCMLGSSYTDVARPYDWAVWVGGLSGRSGLLLGTRARNASALGFEHILCPKDSAKRAKPIDGITLHGADTVAQAMAMLNLYRR